MSRLFESHKFVCKEARLELESNYYEIIRKYNRIRKNLEGINIMENTYYDEDKYDAVDEMYGTLSDFRVEIDDLKEYIFKVVEAMSFSNSILEEYIEELFSEGKYYTLLEKFEDIEIKTNVISDIIEEIFLILDSIYDTKDSDELTLGECIDLAQVYDYVKAINSVYEKMIKNEDCLNDYYINDKFECTASIFDIATYCDQIILCIEIIMGNNIELNFCIENNYDITTIFNSITNFNEIGYWKHIYK